MTHKKEDKDIVQLLARRNAEIDRLMREEQGLPAVLAAGFRGGLTGLMQFAYVAAVLLAVALFYCGYRFYTAPAADLVFWGVLLLLCFQAQVGTKQWIWAETQRAGTMRELKKLQLVIEQLQSDLQH
ncbi:MAG: DUF6768 family protein [Rheinheimera sp.]|nr:DUF6768 family protein [Rheinheimera sp.]